MCNVKQVSVSILSMFVGSTLVAGTYGGENGRLRPTDAVVKELFNRTLNHAYDVHDGVIYNFTGKDKAVSNYFKFKVTSAKASNCQSYEDNIVSCVISYKVETAANDPMTEFLIKSIRPVRREFQLRGDRWYLLPQR